MARVDVQSLLAWFRRHRRSLPWRTPAPRDPYLVLLSEVMLQQTQVSRVAAQLPGFLARFPTVEALAAAGEEEVVAAFTGLGYYRRARKLHALARLVAEQGWPQTAQELAKLPGLGPYTAAAVAAFAFGQLEPPVDANLCRLTARLLALPYPAGSKPLYQAARSLALKLADFSGTGEVFEALMELGALVCKPKRPFCPQCPLARNCLAAKQDPTAFPLPKPKRARQYPIWVALWVENPLGYVLLQQLTEPPLLGLWLPPLDRSRGKPEERAKKLAQMLSLPSPMALVGTLRHHITHRTISVKIFVTESSWQLGEEKKGFRWAHPTEALPTSSLFTKMAALIGKNRKEDTYGKSQTYG